MTISPSVLYAGAGGEASVNGQDNACDGAGCPVIAQEENAAQKFFAFYKTIHGSPSQDLPGTCGWSSVLQEQQRAVLAGYQKSRCDGIAADARSRKMDCQPLREIGDSGFCRGICRDLGQRRISVEADRAFLTFVMGM